MVEKLNQALGSNVITKDTPVVDIKEALYEAGLDPEHTITQAHLLMENPRILKDLGITYGVRSEVSTPMPPARKSTVTEQTPVATKQTPKVVAPTYNNNPTFTASPFAKPAVTETEPETKAQPKVQAPVQTQPSVQAPVNKQEPAARPPVTKRTLPKVEEVASKPSRPWFTLPEVQVEFNWKTSAAVGDWIYSIFGGSDEDVKNVFKYLENGGSLPDAWDIAENYVAKQLGSEVSDLIGDTKSMRNPETDPGRAAVNWGSSSLGINREPRVKANVIVPKLYVSNTPSVDKDVYTSKSFIANLKNSDNKFTVLNNIHANSGIRDLNSYYNNFNPVNGSIVFTIQNDVVSGQKPLTKITKDDKWYSDNDFLLKLEDGNIKVTKGSSLKEGDDVFKLKNKVFSFDDFDIKDGKINTVFDDNINALIPVIKKDAKTYKGGTSFVIGLTDKLGAGYIPIESASQYGKSRGGSFIVFNNDMSQQYMVGGSFKNLYDFYQDLKKRYPNDTFKFFGSDTGSYSNSFFPKSGKIDGDVYRKSNNRNTWGEVQHIVLMN
jgi:hypothetical protein